jgi:hypothetical protein
MTLLEDSTQLKHKLATSEKQVLKAPFEQHLSQLTYEQKQKPKTGTRDKTMANPQGCSNSFFTLSNS